MGIRLFMDFHKLVRCDQHRGFPVEQRDTPVYHDLIAEVELSDLGTLFIGHKKAFDLSDEGFVP